MLLALDIGNSALKGAVFDGHAIVRTFRVAHAGSADARFDAAFRSNLAGLTEMRASLCSVVPAVTRRVQRLLQDAEIDLHVISHRSALPIRLGYDDPASLGTDRIAAAAAAYVQMAVNEEERRPVVALDVGSAATFNVLDAGGLFIGGLIWAGPDLVRRALAFGTAQLPVAVDSRRVTPIATNTIDAIASAAELGFIDGAQGLLRRIAASLETSPYVVLTGGRSELLHAALDLPHRLDPHLVLQGVRLIASMNQPAAARKQ